MGIIVYLEEYIEQFFRNLGSFIGRKPKQVILVTFLLTFLMSLGLVFFEEDNEVRTQYCPINAPSLREYAVAKEFLGQSDGTMDPTYMMVQAKDGGSLLRAEYLSQTLRLIKRVMYNVTVMDRGRPYTFMQMCHPYCEINDEFLAFIQLYDPDNPVTYTYPAIEVLGTRLFIGNNVYGIQLNEGTNELRSFKYAVALFFLVVPEWRTHLIYDWTTAVWELVNQDEFNLLKAGISGDATISAEVERMGRETAPVLVASVIAIIIFVVGSSFRQVAVNSKPWESLCGCIIPLVALLTSTGLISAFGLKFQSICVASLFLVTSVGVDDVFIILRAWDRTQQSLPAHERLSKTLKDAGPSITVSSLTNALSFAIGILSTTPAVRTFSIYSCLSIIICYFYQLILFTAILVLSDRREKRGYQSLLCCLKANPQARNNFLVTLSDLQLRVVKYWSNVISTWSARFVLSLFMLAYYYYSIVGASRLHAHIALERMFLPDSYLADFHQTLDVALKEMQPLNVFVMNPGDLRNVTRMEEMKAMVKEYENAKFMYGSDSTFFWLPLYEEFLEFYSDTENFTYVEIPAFFGLSPYEMMKSLVKMNESACILDQPECISSFFFVTNFRDVVKYHEMIPAVAEWRRIAAKYSDLGVVPYSHHVPFVDQTLTIESTVIWSVAAALTCTAAVCFIFIPNTISILCAVYSVFSISIGIFGLLSHWGIDLDPLSMAALLIAIGCSVDFTAHISYHYYRAKAEDPRERLEKSLAVIGWPMLQVGISTTIALLPLLLKQSYLALVFLKTVIVVVGLGVFHGLVVLPAILTATGKLIGSSENSAVSSERSSQRSNERVESFYKNQRLIKKINHEIGHLGIPEMKPNRIFWGKKRGDKVEPGDATNLPTGPIAFIHRFELGRVALTPPLPRKTTDSTLSQVEKMEDILRSPPSK